MNETILQKVFYSLERLTGDLSEDIRNLSKLLSVDETTTVELRYLAQSVYGDLSLNVTSIDNLRFFLNNISDLLRVKGTTASLVEAQKVSDLLDGVSTAIPREIYKDEQQAYTYFFKKNYLSILRAARIIFLDQSGNKLTKEQCDDLYEKFKTVIPIHVRIPDGISILVFDEEYPVSLEDLPGESNSGGTCTATSCEVMSCQGPYWDIDETIDDQSPDPIDFLYQLDTYGANSGGVKWTCGSCENACQGCQATSQFCYLTCQHQQTGGGCIGSCQSSETEDCCDVVCQVTCEFRACETSCTISGREACNKNCELSCQVSCTQTCTQYCERGACQSVCQIGCESGCERECQVICETACQGKCQLSGACQTGCEMWCEEACQMCVQAGCSVVCQTNCTANCIGPDDGGGCGGCEIGCQGGSTEGINPCATHCQLDCQGVGGCQLICQTVCQTYAQANPCVTQCQMDCMGHGGCQTICQTACQSSGQTDCCYMVGG